MKIKLLLFVLLVSTAIFPQILDGPYFNGLTGMEDKNGNTHLFYRIYDLADSNEYKMETHNNIWHYDVSKNIDTFFQYDLAYQQAMNAYYSRTNDIKFWNSDPSKYILCGGGGTIDGRGFVKRFDMQNALGVNSFLSVEKIFISGKNDSLLLAACYPWFISKDGGWKWDTLKSYKYMHSLIGLHPQKDSTIFFIGNSYLWKSSDLGFHASIVDSSFTPLRNELVFDADMKHVYFLGVNKDQLKALYVSDNEGETGSWKECFVSSMTLMLSIDKTAMGNIYITDGNRMYFSGDYGKSFISVRSFAQRLTGMYKKSNSGKLYASDHFNIFELDKDSIKVVKNLPIPEHVLSFYPLAKGNKWIYDTKTDDHLMAVYYGNKVREVIGDSVMNNGKKYFCIKEITKGSENDTSYFFERIDTAAGLVYRYYNSVLPSNELVTENLAAFSGDTLQIAKGNFNVFTCNTFFSTKWAMITNGLTFASAQNGIGSYEYSLIKNIGLANYLNYSDGPTYSADLKGCRINGIIYGDTAITAVKTGSNALPTEFSLSQNYPNPFNPVTVIKYSLLGEAKVVLNIYNTLGQRIKELVNEIKPAGIHEISFDAKGLPSGIYFYRIQAGKFSETKKLILLK